VVPRNPAATPKRVTTMEADHPLPTSASLSAGRALIAMAETLGPRDLAICTFTGGSSALASVPAPGVSIAEKRDLHRLLLASGMSIVEINTVRKHVSAIKGGRLARAIHPAAIVNLTVSDVVGDPLDCITDLTVPDRSTAADAVLVLEEYGLMDTVPATVREHLRASPEAESPDLGDMDITSEIVARGADGSDAVVASARSRGLASVRLGALLEGDAATVGGVLATLARESQVHGAPWPRGAVLVGCGGECTVRLDSHEESHFGRGGPNLEAAVSAALALRQAHGVVALFLDTDGADGGTAVAGGLVDWSTEERSRALGVSLRSSLIAHTTMSALEAVGDAVVTGLTQTNANDLVLLVVG
jgi:glycerate-2-kinase